MYLRYHVLLMLAMLSNLETNAATEEVNLSLTASPITIYLEPGI
jgi:hypothetical protein